MARISNKQIIELYNVLLMRDPEPEALRKWSESGWSYEMLRNGLMESHEFKLIQSKLAAARRRLLSSPANAWAVLSDAFRLAPGEPRGVAPKSEAFRRLLDALSEDAKPGIVVAIGGERADDVACHVASIFEAVPFSATTGDHRGGLTRLPLNPAGIVSALDAHGLGIGMTIIGLRASASDAAALYESLPETGTLLCLPGVGADVRQTLEQMRGAVWGEHLDADDYALFTRAVWPFRVNYPPIDRRPSRPAVRHMAMADIDRRIALGVIVKNERTELPGMLRSCQGLMRSVIVLDTGSTDGTIGAARATLEDLAVPYAIHEAPFVDFAQARNALIDLVPSGIDWLLMLDADERLTPEDVAGLQDLSTDPSAMSFLLPRYNVLDRSTPARLGRYPDRQARFFRVSGERRPHYVNAVHEALIVDGASDFPPLNGQSFGGSTGGPHIHHRVFAKQESFVARDALYSRLAASG